MSARDSLELSIVGRWASLSLEGEYDLANAERIPNAARYLLARGVTQMTFDLCRVEFLDVSAINALRSANELLVRRGGRPLLVGLSTLVERVLHLTGLDRALPALAGPVGSARSAPPGDDGTVAPADELASDLATLTRSLLAGDTLTADLSQIVRTAAATLKGASNASCTLVALGSPRTAAPSDPLAVEVDLAQYDHGGPCVRAASTGERATLRAAGDDAAVVSATGVSDACSVPVTLGGKTIGSLNCYASDATFGDEAEAMAEVFAGIAAAAVERSCASAAARRSVPAPPGLTVLGGAAVSPDAASVAVAYRHLTRPGALPHGRLAAASSELVRRVTS